MKGWYSRLCSSAPLLFQSLLGIDVLYYIIAMVSDHFVKDSHKLVNSDWVLKPWMIENMNPIEAIATCFLEWKFLSSILVKNTFVSQILE